MTNVEHYAHIVKQKAGLRKLAHEAAAIQERALADNEDAGAIIARATDTLSRIAADSTAACSQSLFDTPEEIENASPLRFAVQGFLQCEAATLIAGLSGDFKTWLALCLAKSLLDESRMLWDTFAVLHKATRVIYLIPETARMAAHAGRRGKVGGWHCDSECRSSRQKPGNRRFLRRKRPCARETAFLGQSLTRRASTSSQFSVSVLVSVGFSVSCVSLRGTARWKLAESQ